MDLWGPNLINDGNFSSWTTTSPCFYTGYTYYTGSSMPSDNYSVDIDPSALNPIFAPTTDHTGDLWAKMLICNSGPLSPSTPAWEEDNIPVCAGTDYDFSAFYANLEQTANLVETPQFVVVVTDAATSAVIYASPSPVASIGHTAPTWDQILFTVNTGSATSVNIQIFEVNPNYINNDFALDDISFCRICTTSATETIYTENISGPSSVCVDNDITLFPSVPGGTWLSLSPGIATVSGGVVHGVAAGTATIVYFSTTGCALLFTVTVTSNPILPITGTFSICLPGSFTLGDLTPGGVWSSSDPTVANPIGGGVFTGGSAGVATVTYSAAGCYVTHGVVANTTPLPVRPVRICQGTSYTLPSPPPIGTWAPPSVVSPGGVISTTAPPGVYPVTYTTAAGCSTSTLVTILDCSHGDGGGELVLCEGETATLPLPGGVPTGGTWSATGTGGIVNPGTGLITTAGYGGGTLTVTYTVGGTPYTYTVIVFPELHPCILATYGPPAGWTFSGIPPGAVVFYTAYDAGHVVVPPDYYFPGFFIGPGFLTYPGAATAVLSICIDYVEDGPCTWYCSSTSTPVCYCCAGLNPLFGYKAGQSPAPGNIEIPVLSVIPNPNNGLFTLSGDVCNDDKVTAAVIEITDMTGRIVHTSGVAVSNGNVHESFRLGDNVANGLYIIKIKTSDGSKVVRFELAR